MKWEDDGAWCGELTTHNTGECPNAVVVSRLSQILEETPHPKYNLTPKACQGILRRAERRGKDLPKLLKEVLIRQSQGAPPQERTEASAPTEAPTSYAVRTRGGCDGGGKGALVQTDKSGTLGTGNDQTIFTPTPINLMVATRCKALGRGTGFGVGEPGDPANTISAAHSHGVFATAIPINDKATRWQGAQAGGIGYSEEVSPTLAAAPSGTNRTPAVVAYSFDSLSSNSMKSKNPHSGCREVDVAKTLDTTDPTPSKNQGGIAVVAPAVALDMTHACDVIRECGEQVPALQARMGTGGNQVPLTYGIGNGQACEASIMAEEVSQTLNTMHDAQAVMCEDVSHSLRAKANCAYREDAETYICSAVDCRNGQESDVGGALQARTGHTLNANGVVRSNMIVRRLTPLECERLQGFPDHWTDIGEWIDEKGKKHKDADSPRYKALGNSIALPFWDWMLRRMARYLPEDATLGSLFDGIAGFPLIWERIHGRGTARWASEIEPFPIAVTKKWFGEE